MATFGHQMGLSMIAGVDLSGVQYHAMRISAANAVNVASNGAALSTVGYVGVLQNKPQNGEHASVAYLGESKITAGAALTVGTWITTNGSGRAIAVSSGNGEMCFGRALVAAGGDGDVITALLFPAFRLDGAE